MENTGAPRAPKLTHETPGQRCLPFSSSGSLLPAWSACSTTLGCHFATGCFALDRDRQLLAPSMQRRSACGSHVVFQLRLESCELEMNVAAREIRFLL